MKIAVWKTGHEIADTVADALKEGIPYADTFYTGAGYKSADAHIGYGILRGMETILRRSTEENVPCFLLDRGYFNPGHYDGYYRISYRGTQALWNRNAPRTPFEGIIEPFRTGGAYVLICPPTDAVRAFFGIDREKWIADSCRINGPVVVRSKSDPRSLDEHLNHASAVITFNSSVGWEAVRRGIPCLSSVEHSTVGSFYRENSLDKLAGIFQNYKRDLLFSFMSAHQLTLSEIREGKAWGLIRHYTSSSGTTAGKQSPAK